jgi:hypothetical protein
MEYLISEKKNQTNITKNLVLKTIRPLSPYRPQCPKVPKNIQLATYKTLEINTTTILSIFYFLYALRGDISGWFWNAALA